MKRYKYLLLTLVFGLAVFLFWWLRYPFALTYQEQFQLFLFDGDYFCERMSEPGGLARYVAEFLTQFYNSVSIGAAILAVLFMLLQRLTWRLMRFDDGQWYLLSFLPAFALWYALGDESVLPAYVVSLILGLAAIIGWRQTERYSSVIRWSLLVVLMPLLYWLIGPLALMVALCMAPLSMTVAAVVYTVAILLGSAWVLPYSLLRLAFGVGYYRFPETLPYTLMLIPLLVAGLCYCRRFLPEQKPWMCYTLALVSAALLVSVQAYGFDAKKYELVEYDYLVRIRDWQGIIAKAESQNPDLPMSVAATNLALAMTNQLGERALDFYQHGSEGLLPSFEMNFTLTQLTGEIYFFLGLVNTAQRFAFESMESLPNYNKSGRVVKRLAETNLINGQYDVARKYLQMLDKTIFYRPWAQRTMAMLGDEKAISAHSLYGTLRKYRLQEDFLFSEDEKDKICGQLFMHNHQNAVAMQYLVMAPLLDGDAERFMAYVGYVQSVVNYNPRYVREAIAKIRRVK